MNLPLFDTPPPCAEVADPDLYFPGRGDSSHQEREAAAVCSSCRFTTPCLSYAVRHGVEGIWAGTSERDRARMRRELGVRAVEVTIERNTHNGVIDRLTDVGWSAAEIAARTGVTKRTVVRRRAVRRAGRPDLVEVTG